MKTIINIKTLLITILTLNLQATIINQQSFYLFAQDPQLFNNTWYLQKVNIEDNEYFPPSNAEVEFVTLTFYDNASNEFDTNVCNVLFGELEYDSTQNFTIQNSAVTLLECNMQDNSIFEGIYFGFFFDSSNNHLNDPFPYVITTIGDDKELILNNTKNDQAFYSDTPPLSTPEQSVISVKLFPMPTVQSLHLQTPPGTNLENINLFDVQGRQTAHYPNGTTQLDVSTLPAGVYFLELTVDGQRMVRKVVKK